MWLGLFSPTSFVTRFDIFSFCYRDGHNFPSRFLWCIAFVGGFWPLVCHAVDDGLEFLVGMLVGVMILC